MKCTPFISYTYMISAPPNATLPVITSTGASGSGV